MTHQTKRSLGLFSVIAMVLSLQLGSGMFFLPRLLAPQGVWGLLSWILAGAGALALCHVFSALAQAHPMAGGPQVYIQKALGKTTAFYVGWTYWILGWLGSCPLLMLAVKSLENMMGQPLGAGQYLGVQCLILWSLMMLNIRGSQLSGLGERIFALLKMLPLLILPLISLPFWDKSLLMAPVKSTPFSALNAATLLTFWGFVGLEAGTTLADSVKNPEKIIPRALFYGTLLAIGIYMFNTCAILSVVPRDILQKASNSYATLLEHILGPGWGKIIDATVFIVCLGSLNSWILAGGQVMANCAQSGLFLAFFGKTNAYNSPSVGIQVTTGCLFLCTLFTLNPNTYREIQRVIHVSTGLYMGIYLLCIVALMVLRKGQKRSWLLNLSMATSGIFCLWILHSLSKDILTYCLVIPMIGMMLRDYYRKRRKRKLWNKQYRRRKERKLLQDKSSSSEEEK